MTKQPNSDTAGEQLATPEQMAAMSFEPWFHVADEWTPPTNKEWADAGRELLPCVRLAWCLLYKTKAELEASLEAIEEEVFDDMMDGFSNARNVWRVVSRFSPVPKVGYCAPWRRSASARGRSRSRPKRGFLPRNKERAAGATRRPFSFGGGPPSPSRE